MYFWPLIKWKCTLSVIITKAAKLCEDGVNGEISVISVISVLISLKAWMQFESNNMLNNNASI